MPYEESEAVRSPATLNELARAMSKDLPRRLALLRQIGKQTRALPRGKPKR